MCNLLNTNKRGFSIVEVLAGASIIAVAIFALMNAYAAFLKAEASSSKTVQSTYLLEEGLEAARYMRDSGYTNNFVTAIGTSTVKYFVLVASSTSSYYVWQATSTIRLEDGVFTRTIKLDDVKRDDITQDISNNGTYDADTKKVTVSVFWLKGGSTSTKTISTYLTNIYGN